MEAASTDAPPPSLAALLAGPASAAPEALPALLDAGCSLRYVRVHGLPPLLYCCACYDEELAIRMLSEGVGVDLDAPDQSGFTPLHYAADAGLHGLAQALLAAGCDTAARNDDMQVPFGPPVPGGKAPLHLAACRGDEAMLELLLEGGAGLGQLDVDGNSAWALAGIHCRPRCVALLARATALAGEPAPAEKEVTAEAGGAKKLADQRAATKRLESISTPTRAVLFAQSANLVDTVLSPTTRPAICARQDTTRRSTASLFVTRARAANSLVAAAHLVVAPANCAR